MSNPRDPLLTFDEAGELLGTGPGLPRRLVAEGRLDHVQDGRTIRIPQSALIAYLTVDPDTDQAHQPVDAPLPGRTLSVVRQHDSATGDAAPAA